jgi:aryl-alcohol dehydrogenase-like predicted oxidoreductase
MEYRPIGTSGREVSVISLGSWNTYNRLLFEDAVAFLRGAHALGVNLFDTSFYPIGPHKTLSGPHTEVIFGRMLEASGIHRDDYVLSEKLWFYSYPEQSLGDQMDRSLFRLGAKYADLVLAAMPRADVDWTVVLKEIGEIVTSGRARMWGAMNFTAEGLRQAYEICAREKLPLPQVVQIKYSVLRRNVVESEAWTKLFDDTGITMQTSDSLEGGLLAGNLSPQRETGSDNGGLRPRFIERYPQYEAIARRLGATPAQLALGFCMQHPRTSSVLVGASSLGQVKDNIGAIELAKRHSGKLGDELQAFAFAEHQTDKAYRGRLPVDDLGGFKNSYVRPVAAE